MLKGRKDKRAGSSYSLHLRSIKHSAGRADIQNCFSEEKLDVLGCVVTDDYREALSGLCRSSLVGEAIR